MSCADGQCEGCELVLAALTIERLEEQIMAYQADPQYDMQRRIGQEQMRGEVERLQQQLKEARAEIDEAKRVLLLTREQDREGFERLHRQVEDIAQKTAALLDERDTLRQQVGRAMRILEGWLFVTSAKDDLFIVQDTKAWLKGQEGQG